MAKVFVTSPDRGETEYLQETLERAGYQVAAATSLEESVPLLLNETYSVIGSRPVTIGILKSSRPW